MAIMAPLSVVKEKVEYTPSIPIPDCFSMAFRKLYLPRPACHRNLTDFKSFAASINYSSNIHDGSL